MKSIYGILEMENETLESLKKDKDYFIKILMEELCFISGQLEAYDRVINILEKRLDRG